MAFSGWGRYPTLESRLFEPVSASEIEASLGSSEPWGTPVIARGAGRSYGDSALAETLISTRYLDNFSSLTTSACWSHCAALRVGHEPRECTRDNNPARSVFTRAAWQLRPSPLAALSRLTCTERTTISMAASAIMSNPSESCWQRARLSIATAGLMPSFFTRPAAAWD